MASVPVGRIIYTRQALPAVELVNFGLDGGDIVIRTDRSGKLAAAARGAIVAFETDSIDPAAQAGWSVTAIGPAQEVTEPDEIARLEQAGISSWAPGNPAHFIRITPGIINGRRLARGGTAASGQDAPARGHGTTRLARAEGVHAAYAQVTNSACNF